MQKVNARRSLAVALAISLTALTTPAFARDIEYKNTEVAIRVTPGEPTQISFPGNIAGGMRNKVSSLSLDHRQTDLVVIANDALLKNGEAIIVQLQDGRSYSLRVLRSSDENPRDDVVSINDSRGKLLSEEEEPAYQDKKFDYAPPSTVAGLMREMVLSAEFGKSAIPGYRVNDSYKGQSVLNDGTVSATIDRIYVGTNLWGYVLDAQNLLSQTQKLNPAAFRIDGTRAISAKEWELAAVPTNVEQQVAHAHKTKVYVITKAKR